MNTLAHRASTPKAIVFILLSLVIFIFRRYYFYTEYYIAGYESSLFSYYEPVLDALNFKAPLFYLRTPAYPFFLYICYNLHFTNFDILLLQSVLSFIFYLFISLNIFRLCATWLQFIAATALLLLFYNSATVLTYETSILPECLYTNLLVLYLVIVAATAITNNFHFDYRLIAVPFFLLSLKPQAMFIIIPLTLVLFYAYFKNEGLAPILRMTMIWGLLIGLCCCYNHLTFQNFCFSKIDKINKAFFGIYFLGASPQNSPQVNACIESINAEFSPQEQSIIHNSTNNDSLATVFTANNSNKVWAFLNCLEEKNHTKLANIDTLAQLTARFQEEKKELFRKYVQISFTNYFNSYESNRQFYFREFGYRKYRLVNSSDMVVTDNNFMKLALKEDFEKADCKVIAEVPDFDRFKNEDKDYIALQPQGARLNYAFENYLNYFLYQKYWLYFYYASLLFSVFLFFKKVEIHNFYMFFAIGLLPVINAIVTAYLQPSLLQFSYTLEYTYIAYPVFVVFLFFQKPKNEEEQHGKPIAYSSSF